MFWQNAEGAPRYFQLYKEASKDIFTACLWFFMNYQDGRYSDLPHVMAFLNHDYKEIFEVLATEPEIRDMITSLVRVYRNKDFELLDFAMLPLQTMLNKLRTPEICWLLHKDGDDFKTRRGDGNWLMVIARDTQQTLLDLITTMIAGAPPTKNTKSWMDFFKIRASWGQNGNKDISKYQYLATIALSGDANDNGYKFGSATEVSTGGIPHSGAYANIVPNPDLTWETSEQLDFGFDARFLNSRLGLTFDWYKKTTKDWLIAGQTVAVEGTNPAAINGGDVRNTGVEIALTWNDRIGKDFRYNVGVNFTTNKNKVTRIANDNHYINGPGGVLSQGTEYCYRAEEGKPIGYFYGMSYSGIWQNQAQIDQARKDGKAVLDNAQPGDCIWDDWNGDGLITFAEAKDAERNDICDRHEIGNPNPDVMLGINLGLNWKGLDFSVNGAGAFGHQIMRSYRSFSDAPYQNYDTSIFNRWYGEGTSNDQPRISATGHQNTNWVSTRYMEDADYFKIKTITLGYDFKHLWKACPFQQLRFYVQAQNLHTFTKYTGLDPEVGNNAGGEGWASGIDLGLYPPSRTYLVGASIKF